MRVSYSGGDAFKALVVCVGSLRKSPKNKANTIWPTHKPITKPQATNPQVPMCAPESTEAPYPPPAAGLCLTVGQITVLQSALSDSDGEPVHLVHLHETAAANRAQA